MVFIIVYKKISIIDKSNILAIYVQNQMFRKIKQVLFIKLQFHSYLIYVLEGSTVAFLLITMIRRKKLKAILKIYSLFSENFQKCFLFEIVSKLQLP